MSNSPEYEEEHEVVADALARIIESREVQDWEYQTLLGVTRDEMRRVRDRWLNMSVRPDDRRAIANALNTLLSYPGVVLSSEERSRFAEMLGKSNV